MTLISTHFLFSVPSLAGEVKGMRCGLRGTRQCPDHRLPKMIIITGTILVTASGLAAAAAIETTTGKMTQFHLELHQLLYFLGLKTPSCQGTLKASMIAWKPWTTTS